MIFREKIEFSRVGAAFRPPFPVALRKCGQGEADACGANENGGGGDAVGIAAAGGVDNHNRKAGLVSNRISPLFDKPTAVFAVCYDDSLAIFFDGAEPDGLIDIACFRVFASESGRENWAIDQSELASFVIKRGAAAVG